MNARGQIAELLDEWSRLTQAESDAIQSASWPDLQKIQIAKSNLQPQITGAMQTGLREQNARQFRVEFEKLIALESRNQELLAGQVEKARLAKTSLQKASQNLRRVHHAYARKPEAAWHSYS
ncbi:MAG TPA: hypothetical protein VFM25_06705 [Verrucomicrobiae bacterium]|nr:hypothetical protein [Verrucomicrobiae bacterium]